MPGGHNRGGTRRNPTQPRSWQNAVCFRSRTFHTMLRSGPRSSTTVFRFSNLDVLVRVIRKTNSRGKGTRRILRELPSRRAQLGYQSLGRVPGAIALHSLWSLNDHTGDERAARFPFDVILHVIFVLHLPSSLRGARPTILPTLRMHGRVFDVGALLCPFTSFHGGFEGLNLGWMPPSSDPIRFDGSHFPFLPFKPSLSPFSNPPFADP